MAQAAVAATFTGSNTQGPGQPTATTDKTTATDTTDAAVGTATARATSLTAAAPATRETTIRIAAEATTAADRTIAADKTTDAMMMGADPIHAAEAAGRATAGSRPRKTNAATAETANIIRGAAVGAESTRAGARSAPPPRVRIVQVVFIRATETAAPSET
jgi:hypothetical protein